MSSNIAISVKNIGKCYEMYAKPHHRLFQTLHRGKKQFYKEFWALQNISLEVKKGECIGIIGRNGCGKSTLLQIIAETLAPTTGGVEVNGRVAALLELGSGFNPEFTGRENVYMNGTVLGLSRKEIDEKFADIEAFADIGEFINQPIKIYSSGMKLRLAFAVQTFVDPDILIVDEALAVGDAAFQMKCTNRMRKMIDNGVTILFVSHSMQSIRTFCSRAIWLENGKMIASGDSPDITSRYLEKLYSGEVKSLEKKVKESKRNNQNKNLTKLIGLNEVTRKEPLRRWGTGNIKIENFLFFGSKSGMGLAFEYLEKLTLKIKAVNRTIYRIENIAFAFSIRNKLGIDVVAISSAEKNLFYSVKDEKEAIFIKFEFDNIIIPGEYMLIMAIEYFNEGQREYSDYVENAFLFNVFSERKHFGIAEPYTQISQINEKGENINE